MNSNTSENSPNPVAGTARHAVRGATVEAGQAHQAGSVPPAAARAGTSQRHVPVMLSIAVLALATLVFTACNQSSRTEGHDGHGQTQPTATPGAAESDIAYYTCPMHPSVKSSNPKDTCPICKMDLTAVRKRQSLGDAEGGGAAAIVDIGLARLQQIGARSVAVVKKELTREAFATGVVRYDESKLSEVNVRVGGWVQKLFVDRTGQWVKEGEPLFTLYSPELLAAQRDYLIAVQSAKKLNDETLRASARERLRLWDIPEEAIAEMDQTGEPQVNFTFRAPRSGFVIEKMVLPGQKVESGMTLYRLADLSTVWLEADFYESEIPLVNAGDFVEISFASLPGRDYLSTIEYIYPYIEVESRTQRARVVLQNPGARIKPGMFARVTVEIDLGEQLAVPVEAVMPTGARHLVFVHRGDGRIEPRFIQLGPRAGDDYAVASGLTEDEQVITRANFLIDAESRLQNAIESF